MNVRREIKKLEEEILQVEGQIALYEFVWGRDDASIAARDFVDRLRMRLGSMRRTQDVFDRMDARITNASMN